jgi:hypothetical protein
VTILTLRPTGDSSITIPQVVPTGSSSHYEVIDEVTADTSDYLNAGKNQSGTDRFTMGNHTTESGSINSVTVYGYGGIWAGGSTNIGIYIGTTYYWGTGWSDTVATLRSKAWATNPSTSAAWSWSDIDALIGCVAIAGSAEMSTATTYQMYIEVDYTPAGWANIKNIRAGTGSIATADLSSIWFGTTEVAVADIAEFNGVAV